MLGGSALAIALGTIRSDAKKVMKSLRTDIPHLGLGETLSYLEIDLNQDFPRELFRYWQGRLLAIRFKSHEAPRTPTYPP